MTTPMLLFGANEKLGILRSQLLVNTGRTDQPIYSGASRRAL